MAPKKIRTCALYVRISLATEESVSIERQIEAGEAYAKARGWRIVGTFRDEGVSATHNKPEDRKAWQDLLATREQYDAVVVWKVDRLARRVIDFLNANEAVKARGAGIVAVEDPIDLTTAQGEAFAIMLAVFGQLEAATTRSRVTAARDYLLRSGRYVGGGLPYGYKAIPNPDGPGYIITQDDEAIDYVKEMVRRTLAGLSLYSTTQWLNEVGAPTATMLRAQRRTPNETGKSGRAKRPVKVSTEWKYNTVDSLVRHPLLAGMVPHNPGNTDRERGEDVVRDDDGLPVVDESLAIMPVNQWRAMQEKLAEPNNRRIPRAMRRKHSGVLSGLMWCGDPRHDEPVRMWRGTTGSATNPRPSYSCPECHQTLSNAEGLIVAEFLRERGDVLHLNMVEEVVEGGSVQLQEATIRLAELGREVVSATPERAAEIVSEIARLKDLQEEAKGQPAQVRHVPVGGETRTFREDWEAAETDEQRRTIIGHALDRVVVRRGPHGGWADSVKLARCDFQWLPAGQVATPTDADLAAWAADNPVGA
jgi:DNA invertase Pin-like site-specific DNA recombinase